MAATHVTSTQRRGVVVTLVMTLLFHVFSMLHGVLLLLLLAVTVGGLGLVLLCSVTASTRSSRLFVAWLWRNELWINSFVGEKQTEDERLAQERARGLRREASQRGASAMSRGLSSSGSSLPTTNSSSSLLRSSSTRGREVTKTVMAFSILYFLLFKGIFNVIFAAVPLVLWSIMAINIVPSLSPDKDMIMATDTTGRVFVALATSFFAYQIGVAAASGSVSVSEKIQELLFNRGGSTTSERSSLLATDSFHQSHGYPASQTMRRDMYAFDERDELLRGHEANSVGNGGEHSGGGSSGTGGGRASSTPGHPPPPAAPGFPFDGFRPVAPPMPPMPPVPPMQGDPRRPGQAFENAYRAEPVTREVEFCGVKVTIQSNSEESNDRANGDGGHRSFHGHPYRGGNGRRGGGGGGGGRGRGMGRDGFFHHPGMARGMMEPPPAYGTFSPPYPASEHVPEVFARVVVTEEDAQRSSSSVSGPPIASPLFGRSCSSSPRGQRRGGGRRGAGRHRRADSFETGQPGGGRFAPDFDLKRGAHTRLWEALDLRPSAPSFPDGYPVAKPSTEYPMPAATQTNGLHRSWSENGYKSDQGYTGDADTTPGFRKFEFVETKRRLKEQSRQFKEASKRLKREYKEQVKREARAASLHVDDYAQYAAEQEQYGWKLAREEEQRAKEIARDARELAREEERRIRRAARRQSEGRPSAAETQQEEAETQRKQPETQRKQAETQRKQAETQRKQAETQRKQAEDQQKLAMEAKAQRAVEQQLRFQATAEEDAVAEDKRVAPSTAEELSASYREREHDILMRDAYAIEVERAAQEEVERQRRELEATGLPPPLVSETRPFTVARVMSNDSGSGRIRGRRTANSVDLLVGTSSASGGLFDPDFVAQTRRTSSSRTISVANPYQTGGLSDSDIQAMCGSMSRSSDDLMGLGQFGDVRFTHSPVLVSTLDPEPHFRGVDRSAPTYDRLSPPTSPTASSLTNNSFIESREYGVLSPTNSLHDADFPSEEFQQVYRSIRYTDDNRVLPSQISALPHYEDVPGQRDKVHFCSYAPPSVYPSRQSFRFSVWAFLLNQRHEMRERAEAADPDAQQLSVNSKMILRRGAIVHVTLEAPDGFKILNGATQGFPWEGKIASVDYDIECTDNADFGQVLFKASIVVGTEVAVLRSYVIVSSRKLEPGELEATMLDSQLEVLAMTYQEVPYPTLELKEFVGSGYFGDAYRASYKGEDVVVKTIRASEFGETNDQILKEFQHEAAVLSMFGHHPCVVPFVGASTDMRYPLSLITKYLPFGSLEDNLKKPDVGTNLSTRQRTLMLKDAAAGLLNIHEGGFIHRDVAARNCLVDSDLRVKICDFGLCRRVNAYGGSLMKDSVGPIKYMAPESLQPPHAFSYDSDAWMFGVLMWETYTATPPFASKTPIEAGMAVLQGERLSVPQDLPEDLQMLMEACFHESPSQRPTMADILTELDRATAPTAKSSRPAASPPVASLTTAEHAASRPGLGRHDVPIWV